MNTAAFLRAGTVVTISVGLIYYLLGEGSRPSDGVDSGHGKERKRHGKERKRRGGGRANGSVDDGSPSRKAPPPPQTPGSQPSAGESVVRAAFDVGSGATKVAIGQCMRVNNGDDFSSYTVCLPLLHEDYREVLLRHSLTRDKRIPDATLEKCFHVLSTYAAECRARGCRPVQGTQGTKKATT